MSGNFARKVPQIENLSAVWGNISPKLPRPQAERGSCAARQEAREPAGVASGFTAGMLMPAARAAGLQPAGTWQGPTQTGATPIKTSTGEGSTNNELS